MVWARAKNEQGCVKAGVREPTGRGRAQVDTGEGFCVCVAGVGSGLGLKTLNPQILPNVSILSFLSPVPRGSF